MRIERLIERLERDGSVSLWALHATTSRRLALGIKDRQAGNPHAPLRIAETGGARYRIVWSDGRVSRGWLERRQAEEQPRESLERAREAAYDDPDAARVTGPADMPEVELYDRATADAAGGDTSRLEQRLTRAREAAEDGFRTWSGSFSWGAGSGRVATSRGLDVCAEGTSAGWYISLNGEIGDGFSGRRPESENEFDARLRRLAALARRLERDGSPLPGGVHPLILHPRVVESYVLETLLSNLSGSTVAHGEGHFRREQFGGSRPVLREDIDLRLDPLKPWRLGSYRFTGEGLPAARCTFIRRGVPVTPVLDLKYAHRLGLRPTPQPYSMDVLHFGGSPPLGLERAVEKAGNGALVLSVLGVHTQDRASGDFSLAAPQVVRILGGALEGRLRATLSGNLFALLRDSRTGFVRFEGEPTPGLLVHCRLDPK